jgi:hypothetical protein
MSARREYELHGSLKMAAHSTTGYTDRNNLLAGTAGTLEAIREPNSRYDFGMKWSGANAAVSIPASPNQPSVGLVQGVFPMHPDFGGQAYRNGTGWDSGDAAISVDWVSGTDAGTIKENYYGCTFTGGGLVAARALLATRDNVDPGFGAIGSGRRGQLYSFAMTGTEFRIYNGREADPVVILASPSQGPGYPLSLGAWVSGGSLVVVNIRIQRVRPNTFSSIYSKRDRDADGISSGFHARIYQNATPPLNLVGLPTDVDF